MCTVIHFIQKFTKFYILNYVIKKLNKNERFYSSLYFISVPGFCRNIYLDSLRVTCMYRYIDLTVCDIKVYRYF